MYRLLRFVRPYRTVIIIIILLDLLKMATDLLMPATLGLIIDDVLLAEVTQEEKLLHLKQILFFLCAGLLLRIPIAYIGLYIEKKYKEKVIVDARRKLYQKISGMDLNFYRKRGTGYLKSCLLDDTQAFGTLFRAGCIDMSVDCLFIIGVALSLFILNWKLALVSLLILPQPQITFCPLASGRPPERAAR